MKRPQLKFLKTKKGKLVALVALVGLGVLAFWGYNTYQVRADKQRFEEASVLVDKIYADIVAELGQPENYKKSNTCSRPYQEFTGNGAPNCDVDADFLYGVTGQEQADETFKKIQLIIKNIDGFKPTRSLATTISTLVVVDVEYHDAQDQYIFNGLECTAKYVFDTPDETYLTLDDKNMKAFYVVIGCGGMAKSQLYPLI